MVDTVRGFGRVSRRPLTVVAAMTVVLSAGLTGCSDQQETAPPVSRATVTVNGTAVGPLVPRCERQQRYLSIQAGDPPGEITGVLDVDGVRPVAKWVKIRDLGGFTGDFWEGGVGGIETVRNDGGTTELAGAAYGVYTARPHELAQTARFSMEVQC
jgi:Mycobacterium 19 kDa lipoprotein antigen